MIDPRLRGYVADKQWRSGIDVGALTTELLERLRADDPRDTNEQLPRPETPGRSSR